MAYVNAPMNSALVEDWAMVGCSFVLYEMVPPDLEIGKFNIGRSYAG